MGKKIDVHLYQSPFTHETRILRVTKSLVDANVFDQIFVIASLRHENTEEHEDLDEKRHVWRIPAMMKRRGLISKVLLTLEWSLRAFLFVRKLDLKCVNAHALSVLPLSVLIKFWKRCKLVYEPHEIETKTTEVQGVRKFFSEWTHKTLIRFADVVALTSEGHAEWYRREYKLNNVWVIRNCPYKRKKAISTSENRLRKKFNIPESELLFLYQGAIAKPRGTDLLMRVFSRLPKNIHIVFMGFGSDLDTLFEYEKKFSNIHYHPAVPPNELLHYTSCADVGIHMMDDSCINHLYALPNKPMEYMNAGIPAIVSDLPEMGRLIRDSKAGWVVPVNDENALEHLILNLNVEEAREKVQLAKSWASQNNWEEEEKVLFSMYEKLGLK